MKHPQLLPFLSPTPRCLPSPPGQALPTLSQRGVMMGQGGKSSYAALSTPLCILARRTTRRCPLFLQIQHPRQRLPYPRVVFPQMVKDPGAQSISAVPPIPPLLLQVQSPPTHCLSVFQPAQVLPSPFPLTVKDPGAHFTSSAALPVLLLVRRVPQVTQHQRPYLPVLPPPQRRPRAPRVYCISRVVCISKKFWSFT